jgi:hypothetical protein
VGTTVVAKNIFETMKASAIQVSPKRKNTLKTPYIRASSAHLMV